MGLLANINQFISLFVETFRQFGRGRIWLLLFAYTVLNGFILVVHYRFLAPPFFGVVTAWTGLISEAHAAAFTHYPGQFLVLPYYFGLARLIPGLILEGLVLGGAAVLFRNAFAAAGGKARLGLRAALARWLHLVMAWIVINGLSFVVSAYGRSWLSFFHQDSPRRLMAVDLVVVPFVLTIIVALFFYAFPSIVLYRMAAWRGLWRSVMISLKRPITSFFLAASILLVPLLLSILAGQTETIIARFKPELVFWLLLAGLLAESVANFFWMGTAVRFLLEDETT